MRLIGLGAPSVDVELFAYIAARNFAEPKGHCDSLQTLDPPTFSAREDGAMTLLEEPRIAATQVLLCELPSLMPRE